TGGAWIAVLFAAIVASVAAWMAWPLISVRLDRSPLVPAHFHPLLFNRCGVYQLALLILIAGCMIAYAAIWRISIAETLASMFAVTAGAALTLLLLDID